LLVVMLPPVLDYPLFAAALERYGRNPTDPADIARELMVFGLQAEVETASFRLAVAKWSALEVLRGLT